MSFLLHALRKRIKIKFNFLHRYFKNQSFNLLDIGAGNHSASTTTAVFPNCQYHGLDIDKNYANSEADFKKMTAFYELDLTALNYNIVPNNYFDALLMTHVIEHLPNGDEVLPLLINKLKPGGVMYIEYPGIKSTKLPSMHGSLNFYDDDTHVRIYNVQELANIYQKNNCTVLRSGTRRNYYYIFAMPLRIIISLVTTGKLNGNLFWDILGFAEFLEVRKNK
jgi:trans-aconitate methyltransferase